MKSLSNTLIAALIALVLTLIVALLPTFSFFEALDSSTSDLMMRLCYSLHEKYSPKPPDSHLVFAAVDERSVEALGRWPFPRGIHAAFLKVLAPEKPKVVGWDIFFTEASSPEVAPADKPTSPPAPASPAPDASGIPPADKTSPATAPTPADDANGGDLPVPDDQAFADNAGLVAHMVTASKREDTAASTKEEDLLPTQPFQHVVGDSTKLLSAKSALLPYPALRKKSYFGFADEEGGSGGVRRTMPLVVNIDGRILPSLDLQILLQYWDVKPDQVVVTLGHDISFPRPDGTQVHIPINDQGLFIINYRARLENFVGSPYVWLAKGLDDKANNVDSEDRKQLPAIKDNIVVVGVTIAGTDSGVTPLDNVSPLVGTHLNVLNNLLQSDFLRPLSGWIWIPVYAVFLFVAGNLMLRVGIAPMIPIGLLAMLILGVTGFACLWFGNLQTPVAGPEFGLLVLASVIPTKRFFGEEREKRRVRSAMSAYLSEKVMLKVLEHPDGVKLGGSKQEITVMFCDIRGFTKYCDDRDPQEVLNVVNEYFEEMTQVVFKYDGTVDKYIGDCIMAFWNAPQVQPDHAQRAVCCAMEMRYALANFKTKRAGKDTELFECGIGIHTGEALVGNMGSSLKLNYTAMGSTVNMGARLEALTKRLNERILISQATVDQLQGDFPLTDRGEAMVPGFANPIHVYAVGADQDISSALKVGRTLATKQDYTAEEVTKPIWEPAPLPKDADPNP